MAEITIRAFAKFREMFGAENVISVSDGSTVLDSLLQFAKTVSAAEDEIFECGVLKSHIVLMYNRAGTGSVAQAIREQLARGTGFAA